MPVCIRGPESLKEIQRMNLPVGPPEDVVRQWDASLMQPGMGTESLLLGSVDTHAVQDLAITNAKIANLAVDTAKIKDLAVTNAKIENAAIDTAKIKDLSVTNAKIADAAINTAKIEDAAITRAKIAEAAIGSAQIEDAAITSAKIGTEVVEASHIKAGSINAGHIEAAAIHTAHIEDLAVTDAKISSLSADKITAGIVNTALVNIYSGDGKMRMVDNALEIWDNQVPAVLRVKLGDISPLGNGTMYGIKIMAADGTTTMIDDTGVYSAGIKNAAITEEKVDDEAIVTRALKNLAVTTEKIADLAVTTAKIADASITSAKIAEAAIGQAQIGEAAIGTANIADLAVTTAKIQDGAIDTAKIRDAAITSAKIERWILGKSGTAFPPAPLDGEVFYRTDLNICYRWSFTQGEWIAVDFLNDGSRLADGIITNVKIADATIADAKIANLHGSKIIAGTITSEKIDSINADLTNITAGDGAVIINNQGVIVNQGKIVIKDTLGTTIIDGSGINANAINVGTLTVDVLNLQGWVGIVRPRPDASNLEYTLYYEGGYKATSSSGWTLVRSFTFDRATPDLYADLIRIEFNFRLNFWGWWGRAYAYVRVIDDQGHYWNSGIYEARPGSYAPICIPVCWPMKSWPTLGNITVQLYLRTNGSGTAENFYWKITTNDMTANRRVV